MNSINHYYATSQAIPNFSVVSNNLSSNVCAYDPASPNGTWDSFAIMDQMLVVEHPIATGFVLHPSEHPATIASAPSYIPFNVGADIMIPTTLMTGSGGGVLPWDSSSHCGGGHECEQAKNVFYKGGPPISLSPQTNYFATAYQYQYTHNQVTPIRPIYKERSINENDAVATDSSNYTVTSATYPLETCMQFAPVNLISQIKETSISDSYAASNQSEITTTITTSVGHLNNTLGQTTSSTMLAPVLNASSSFTKPNHVLANVPKSQLVPGSSFRVGYYVPPTVQRGDLYG